MKTAPNAHGVTLVNPPGISDPVGEDENCIAFTLQATGGLPLGQTRRASLSLVSTSFNSNWVQNAEGFASGGKKLANSPCSPSASAAR